MIKKGSPEWMRNGFIDRARIELDELSSYLGPLTDIDPKYEEVDFDKALVSVNRLRNEILIAKKHSESITCKKSIGICGICTNPEENLCWYDDCRYCSQPRIEHRYGAMGCRATLKTFEKR